MEALVLLRESRNSWERRNAADALLRRRDSPTTPSTASWPRRSSTSPTPTCALLASRGGDRARRGARSRAARPRDFVDRPDLEQRVLDRQHARLRQELLGWVGKARRGARAAQPRAVVELMSSPWRSRGARHRAARRDVARRAVAHRRASCGSCNGEVRDDPRLPPLNRPELLAIFVEQLAAHADAGGYGDRNDPLPLGPLRVFLERATRRAGHLGRRPSGRDRRARRHHAGRTACLASGPCSRGAENCTARGRNTALELGLTWDDGRALPLDRAVFVQGEEVWRGGRASGLVIAHGELAFIGSAPPPALIERFRTTGGLPLRDDERVPLVSPRTLAAPARRRCRRTRGSPRRFLS